MTSFRFGDSAWRRHASATPVERHALDVDPDLARRRVRGHAHVGGAAALQLGREVRVADDADRRVADRGGGQRRLRARRLAERDMAGEGVRGGHGRGARLAPQRVQRHVHAAAGGLAQRRRQVVVLPDPDRGVGAGLAGPLQPLRAARGGHDPPGPEQPRGLHADQADHAAGAQHEHRLARLQLPPPLQPQPRRQPGDAQRERQPGVEPLGHGEAAAGRDQRALREGAEGRDVLVEVHPRAVLERAHALLARDVRRLARVAREVAPGDPQVDGVQPAGLDGDELPALARDGVVEGPGLGDGPVGREDGGAHGADSTMLRRWTTPASPTTSAGSRPA